LTRSLNFIEQNQIDSTHVQEQSAVVSMKESDANDTAVLITTKNNVNSANNAARSSRFMKCVHSQRTDDEWRSHERESSSSYTRSTVIQTQRHERSQSKWDSDLNNKRDQHVNS